MGTLLIIIFFLLLPTLVICFLAILEEKRKKQTKKDLKKTIEKVAKENKLQVVEIHFFHRKAIAMDRKNKKLIFVNQKEIGDQFCIDLKTLAFCRVVRIKDESSRDIEKVYIEVKNKGINEVSKLVFFDRSFDNIRTKATLIREAEYWRNKINLHRKSMHSSYAFEYVL